MRNPDYGYSETNPLPASGHPERHGRVYWDDPRLKRITRLRLLSDPGFPLWDVSYCYGVLHDGTTGFVLQIGQEGPRALLGRRLLSQRVARLAALLDHDEETLATARLIDLRYADRAVLRTAPASG